MSLLPTMTPQMRQLLGKILKTYLPDWNNLEHQAKKAIGNQKPFARTPWHEMDAFRSPVKGMDHDIWQIEDGICLQKHPTLFERIVAMLMALVDILLAPLRAIRRKMEEMIFALSAKLGQIGGIFCIPFAFLLMIIDFFCDYLAKVLRSVTNPFMLIITIISFPIWLIKTIFSRLIEMLMAPLLAKMIALIQKGQQALIGFLAKYGWLRGVLLGIIRDNSRQGLPVVIPKRAVSEVKLVNKWSLSGSKKFLLVVEGDKLKPGFNNYLALKLKQIIFPYYWERTVHMLMLPKKEAERVKSEIEDALRHDAKDDEIVQEVPQERTTQPGIGASVTVPAQNLSSAANVNNLCPQCKTDNKVTSKFCKNCNALLSSGAAAAVAPDIMTQVDPVALHSGASFDDQKSGTSNVLIGIIAAVVIGVVAYVGYNYFFVQRGLFGKKDQTNNMITKPPASSITAGSGSAAPKLNAEPSSDSPASIATQVPEAWAINTDRFFTREGRPRNKDISKLIAALESKRGEGVPVSKQEFMVLLSKPEAQTIYYKEIMKYATPVSREIQKKEHKDYTQIFMREEYQRAGLEFLKNQRENLERAERAYGVLPRDIVSVLIWESGLGKFTGDYRVVNVFLSQMLFLDEAQEIAVKNIIAEGNLNPLADPAQAQKERKRLDKRKAQAIENMAVLLRYCKKSGFNPFDIKGSWGGAIGNVQFMPANLKYAVDGDRDGKLDLNQWPDAIMSASNFLKIRGGYNSTEAGRRRALMRYNPSSEYVDGVILLAETIWKRHVNGE